MENLTGPRATIVGAGIGGLATALALGRHGWATDVWERATALDGGGAGLVLAPNAVWALRALGVAEEVAAASTVVEATALRAADGRWLSRVPTDEVAARCGAPALGVLRSRLVEALVAAVGRESIHLGCEVDGAADLEADLVVGADGIGSVVRRTWWPDAIPVYAGYTAWRAVVTGLDPGTTAVATETWGRGERFGIVPVGRGEVYVYATANAPARADLGDDLAQLRRRFGGWHEPIPQLLEVLSGATILRHDIHRLEPLDGLHRSGARPVVLVGDAGHAMEPNLGQGAGAALEDAVELGHWLSTGDSIDEALARYSDSRRPRVRALADRSRQVGRVAQLAHPALVAARDAAMALTPASVGRRAALSVADWRPPTAPVEEPA